MSRTYYSNSYQVYPATNTSFVPPERYHRRSFRRHLPVHPPPTRAVYMIPPMPLEQYSQLTPELDGPRAQRDIGTQTDYRPVHVTTSRPNFLDHFAPAHEGTDTRPVFRVRHRVDGEGEDVIYEHVEAQGRPHHGSEHCPDCEHMTATVEDALGLDFRPTLISRSSSGNGVSTPTNRRPGYRVEIREVNKSPIEDMSGQQFEHMDGGDRAVHALQEIVEVMNELLTQARELCEVQKQAVTALQGSAEDMVHAVQDLDSESEEEGIEGDGKLKAPIRSAVVEDLTRHETAKRY